MRGKLHFQIGLCFSLLRITSSWGAVSEEENMLDLKMRHSVREKFLGLSTEYFTHMSSQLRERTSTSAAQDFDAWQAEIVKEFSIPLRLENRDRGFVPQKLMLSLDGTEIGSFHFATGEKDRGTWKWFNVRIQDVPVGERLIKFTLTGFRGRSALRIEGFSSVFVDGTLLARPVGLFVETTLARPFVRLTAAEYREPSQ